MLHQIIHIIQFLVLDEVRVSANLGTLKGMRTMYATHIFCWDDARRWEQENCIHHWGMWMDHAFFTMELCLCQSIHGCYLTGVGTPTQPILRFGQRFSVWCSIMHLGELVLRDSYWGSSSHVMYRSARKKTFLVPNIVCNKQSIARCATFFST